MKYSCTNMHKHNYLLIYAQFIYDGIYMSTPPLLLEDGREALIN